MVGKPKAAPSAPKSKGTSVSIHTSTKQAPIVKKAAPAKQEPATFLSEVLALGGDASDLALLTGIDEDDVDSDEDADYEDIDDGEDEDNPDPALEKELKQFLAGLGLTTPSTALLGNDDPQVDEDKPEPKKQPVAKEDKKKAAAEKAELKKQNDKETAKVEKEKEAIESKAVKEKQKEKEAKEAKAEKKAQSKSKRAEVEEELKKQVEDALKKDKMEQEQEAPMLGLLVPMMDGTWYEQLTIVEQENGFSTSPTSEKSSGDAVLRLRQRAERLLKADVAKFEELKAKRGRGKTSSDDQWLSTVMQSGTMQDRVAALTVSLQEAPVHRLQTIDALLNMTAKRNRREATLAIEAFRDVCLSTLLPNRKLIPFARRPTVIGATAEPLASQSEAGKKRKHPGDAARVVSKQRPIPDSLLVLWYFEDELRTRFLNFVEHLKESIKDQLLNVRTSAVRVTYSLLSSKPEAERQFLEMLVNKIGDAERKLASTVVHLLSQLLDAHPNMKTVVVSECEQLIHRSGGNTRAQYYTFCFLNQIVLKKTESKLAAKLIDIYFTYFRACIKKDEFESRMLSALLTGINRAFPFTDKEEASFESHMDTLYKVAHKSSFNTTVQVLVLLQQVMDVRASDSSRFYRLIYDQLMNTALLTSSKQAMFLNVLYRSIKTDPNISRVFAFVKRLLHLCCACPLPSFVCAVTVIVNRIIIERPQCLVLVNTVQNEDDEEHFKDVIEEDEEDITEKTQAAQEDSAVPVKKVPMYDPSKRDPSFAHAELSRTWELLLLSEHYHPSVARFSKDILNNQMIKYDGDPLEDFTLMKFLDRFVYKNPKAQKHGKGSSLMQPRKKKSRADLQPVNTEQFLNQDDSKVLEDELFFFEYFKRAASGKSSKQKKKKSDEDGDEDEATSDVDSLGSEADDLLMAELGLDKDVDADDDEYDAALRKAMGSGGNDDDADADSDEFGDLDDAVIDDDEDTVGGQDGVHDDDDEEEEEEEDAGMLIDDDDDDDDDELEQPSDDEAGPVARRAAFNDDVDDEEEQDSENEDMEALKPSKSKRAKTSASLYADVDEFQELLERSDKELKEQEFQEARMWKQTGSRGGSGSGGGDRGSRKPGSKHAFGGNHGKAGGRGGRGGKRR